MAALGTVGASARAGVGGSTSYQPSVLGGLIGGVFYGTVGKGAGLGSATRGTRNNPPTPVSYTEVAYATNSATISSASVTWLAGDTITVIVGCEGVATIGTPTATGLVFVSQQVNNAAGTCSARVAVAVAVSGGSSAVSATISTGHAGMGVWVDRGSDGAGRSFEQHTSTRTIALAPVDSHSAYRWTVLDFNAGSPTSVVLTPTPTTTVESAQDAGHYTVYSGQLDDRASLASTSYGTSGGTVTGPSTIVGVEILGKLVAAGNVTVVAVPAVVAFSATAPAVTTTVASIAGAAAFAESAPTLTVGLASTSAIATLAATTSTFSAAVASTAGAVAFAATPPVSGVAVSASPGLAVFEITAPALLSGGTLTLPVPAGTAMFAGTGPTLNVALGSSSPAVSFVMPDMGLGVAVGGSPGFVAFTGGAPDLAIGVASTAGDVAFTPSAPALEAEIPGALATVTFGITVPVVLTGNITATAVAAVAVFTVPVPGLRIVSYGGTTSFTYGGDDDLTATYDGAMDPTFTYA